jgi:hypothetical protein
VQEELRPWYGRALTVIIGVICAGTAVVVAREEGIAEAARFAPWLALMTLACWATFWRPCVVVSHVGVRLVNVLRTIDVPWPAIQLVDTKWALTLVTAVGTFTSWAAPAPGARAAARSLGRDGPIAHRGPPPADGGAAPGAHSLPMRPGDLPETPSGAAATKVRQRWEELRQAGHLDDPKLEREAAAVTWHTGTMAAATTLLVLAIVVTVAA